ncbi:MAG: helix-turn-helix domain-containing protein [Paracoccaceae bacterium]
MEIDVPSQLSALSHPKRLDLFRLLMRRYPDAVAAGEIASALDLKANTASVYLTALRNADLIEQTRSGTSLRYQVNLTAVRSLFSGLLSDCCQNRPDLCLPPFPATDSAPMTSAKPPYSVLFICTANSARSIMAEAILNREGQGRFIAYSAGVAPAGSPHPEVLRLLGDKDYDLSALKSQNLDEFAGAGIPLDFVFTVCDHAANEACPTWPGQPMSAHWGLADPVKVGGNDAEKQLAFQQTYGLLRKRITAFASLPIETLDRVSLQHRLDDIGRGALLADAT